MPSSTADGSAESSPKDPYASYVLGVLVVVYTFNFIDRQIVAILSPAIKADLGLSDTQLGFLKGFAFAVFYSLLGVPIARLADRGNRVSIIAVALALWSGMTALCGLAGSFVHLALARVGVGVGEAGCSPPAHSLLSDYFPAERRASALAIYSAGIYAGMAFAFLAGGWLVASLGWRWAFVLVGLPGIAVAVVVKLTIREPVRGAQDAQPAAVDVPDLVAGVRALLAIGSFRRICLAASLASFAGYGFATWVVDYLLRVAGFTYTEVSVPLAIVFGLGGGIGAFAGGALTDRAARADRGAYLRLPGYSLALLVPVYLAMVGWASGNAIFALMFVTTMLSAFYLGPAFSLVQTLAPANLRALATAVFFLILNLVGLGLGPLAVGLLSDLLAPAYGEAAALRWALASLAAVYLLASGVFVASAAGVRRDWSRLAGERASAKSK